ncbi:MAG: HDIG domain-containing protein [Proteobacteria bacterium]|nr:HDIG domain-containing protein [Pseudomonadota bacterium]MBU1737600.1 HDIG domain-containing protein [Pseudomonadota bacterium]
MIPTVDECLDLFDSHGMLDNIRDHSLVVSQVAVLLTEGVNRAGGNLSLPLVVAAAMLHDIGKTACLDNGRDHAELGRKICAGLGYNEVADIVGDHVCLLNNHLPDITENELVFYADKRVNHDIVVSLEQRENYIVETYGRNHSARIEAIRKNCLKWHQVEESLFARLEFPPEQLAEVLRENGSFFDSVRNTEPQPGAGRSCSCGDSLLIFRN